MTAIEASALTTFELSHDGNSVRMNVLDVVGQPASLRLPPDSLRQLLMAIPQMLQNSMRVRFQDDSLRVIYSMADWSLEKASIDGTVILTFATGDGFRVSFGLAPDVCSRLGPAIDRAPALASTVGSRAN